MLTVVHNLLSTGSAQCMTFCESLSEEEFKSYLKNEGVLEKDCNWLIGEDSINMP